MHKTLPCCFWEPCGQLACQETKAYLLDDESHMASCLLCLCQQSATTRHASDALVSSLTHD